MNYNVKELRDNANSNEADACKPFPPNTLSTPPELTAKRAVSKFGYRISEVRRPSSWDLALDNVGSLKLGGLVLANRSIGSIPECSLGIVVQMMEAHLVQVIFQPKQGGAQQCLLVPMEFLAYPSWILKMMILLPALLNALIYSPSRQLHELL